MAALTLIASATLLTACSGSVSVGDAPAVSADELEKAIVGKITVDGEPVDAEEVGLDVVCDEDLPAEVDATVDCFATDDDGARTGFRPVVTAVDGDDVEFDTPLFVPAEELTAQVQALLEEQGNVLTSLECDEVAGEAGATASCTAQADGAAEPDELLVTIKEVDGLRFRFAVEVVG